MALLGFLVDDIVLQAQGGRVFALYYVCVVGHGVILCGSPWGVIATDFPTITPSTPGPCVIADSNQVRERGL